MRSALPTILGLLFSLLSCDQNSGYSTENPSSLHPDDPSGTDEPILPGHGAGGMGGQDEATGGNDVLPDAVDVVAWVPSWSSAVWKEALGSAWAQEYSPANTLTAVAAQFFVAREDGSVSFDPTATEENLQWVKDYTAAHQMSFILCIHNNDGNPEHGGWNWQLAYQAFGVNKLAHIDALIELADQWEADGIDIDYEGYEDGSPYRQEYAEFIKELATRLHQKNKILTLDMLPYIWNQPNIDWIEDWVGHVDLINPMTYDSSGENAYHWNTYKWQQDTALAAGYQAGQYMVGMSSTEGAWGKGGLGTSVLAHIQENLSGDYNTHRAPVAIWSGLLEADAWRDNEVWKALHELSHPSK